MKEFFIELFSEEIPSAMQQSAKEQMQKLFEEKVLGLLEHKNLKMFITPTRIVLKCDLQSSTNERIEEKRGPQASAPEKAIAGFLTANKISDISKCEVRTINGKDYYIAKTVIPSTSTIKIIPEIVKHILQNFKWAKAMTWSSEIRWARPLRNVFVMFDGVFQKTELFGIPSENTIRGHKLLGTKFSPTSFEGYVNSLRDNCVILYEEERLNMIKSQIKEIETQNSVKVFLNQDLIDEIVGITEYPVAFIASFDEKFLSLPAEILVDFLVHSLKVLPVFDQSGKILSHFVGIANIKDTTNPKIGSTKLLNAKLSDAQFFFEKDLATDLNDLFGRLDGINFYANLGSIKDRVIRIQKAASAIAAHFANVDHAKLEAIAKFAKCDIASSMVFEYPELQGIVGSYIAAHQQQDPVVVNAIKEQYWPTPSDAKSPSEVHSIIYALADKIEYILSFFNLGIIPTGSSDPLGLKRYASAILKIFIDNRLEINLKELFHQVAEAIEAKEHTDLALDFILDKIHNFIEVDSKTLLAITTSTGCYSIHEVIDTIKLLNTEELKTSLERILNAYKRCSNFSPCPTPGMDSIDESLAVLGEEKNFITLLEKLLQKEGSYTERLSYLLKEADSIFNTAEEFFSKVLINDPNPAIKENRVSIMNSAVGIFNSYLNFSHFI